MAVCVDDACRLAHCAECDAHPGACRHSAARYLHPIAYDPVLDEDGVHVGWRVPAHERARWDATEDNIAKWSSEIDGTRARLAAWDADHPREGELRNTCAECGSPLEYGQRMYCSRACSGRAYSRRDPAQEFAF